MSPGDLVIHKYTYDTYINVEIEPKFLRDVNTLLWEHDKVGIVLSVTENGKSPYRWIEILTPGGVGYCYEDKVRKV